jgi:hypothetical protein
VLRVITVYAQRCLRFVPLLGSRRPPRPSSVWRLWSDQVQGLSIARTPAIGIGIYPLLDMVDETMTRLGRVQSKSRRIIPLPGAACYSIFMLAALPAPGVVSP